MAPAYHSTYGDIISALAYALAEPHALEGDAALQPPFNDLANFILHQQGQMPDYLQLPMRTLTRGFDWSGLARGKARFHPQPLRERQQRIAGWKHSALGVKRDLVRYYESLALLGLYSRATPGSAETVRVAETAGKLVLAEPPDELCSDIAVVGSGPGGAITACLLAEAGRDVLLIEEGPYYELESCPPFSRDEMLQKYRHGGQTVALGKNNVAYVEGRCVGGGSEINSGLYHRTPPDILEGWRKDYQVEGIGEKDMRPHFEACEQDVSVSLRPGPAPAASLKLHEGAMRLGWKSLEVPRWFRYGPEGGDSGTRQSMTKTFIPRFLKAGGRLLPRARVTELREEKGQWVLRATHRDGKPLRITAATVFLSGGAVQTPALLRRSGITAHVGNSLRLHPTVKVVARFAEEINPPGMGVPTHQVKQFAPRLSFGCSISTQPYLALSLLDHPRHLDHVVNSATHAANYYAMITGSGSGTVRALPRFKHPLVRYDLPAPERRVLAEGVRKLAEVLFASGAAAVYPAVSGFPPLFSPDELSRLPNLLPQGRGNLMTIHLFSSCPMGEDRTKCAADSFGRVHDHQNLYLADASLLCTAPGVNPQGSIMALTRRNALHFLASATSSLRS